MRLLLCIAGLRQGRAQSIIDDFVSEIIESRQVESGYLLAGQLEEHLIARFENRTPAEARMPGTQEVALSDLLCFDAVG